MHNPRITPKERNLLKGAIRRVFSRSELRRSIVDTCIIKHVNLDRPRVKTWCECTNCHKPTPKSNIQVDHVFPVIPITGSLEEMTWDEVIDRLWCKPDNLDPICIDCHEIKTKLEAKQRREYKKGKKK